METMLKPPYVSSNNDSSMAAIALVNGFDLRISAEAIFLPFHAQRLLAFLALQRRAMIRSYVAGTLWASTTEYKAAASLRSAVWRVERFGPGLVDATRTHLCLRPSVAVDVAAAVDVARRLAASDAVAPVANLHTTFSAGDLLPDWNEEADWLLVERARFHQLRLHALERLCQLLIDHGRYGEAIDAALAAVAADPLRESAHRAVISAHLAEGNTIEAIRQYDLFRMLVAEEMGTRPTRQLEDLMVPAW